MTETTAAGTSTMRQIQPNPRWDRFLQRHPRSSVFHTTAWLEAVRLTYGYDSTAFTTSPPDTDLSDGVVFCVVDIEQDQRRLYPAWTVVPK